MRRTAQCPPREDIESILLSEHDDAAKGRLASHLDACADCRAIADTIEQQSLLEADLNWAESVRAQTPVDIQEPYRRLSKILSDYEILGELGRGGMGVVYKARQPKLDRLVAIKVLPTLLSLSRPDAKERFRREAKLAASLEHTGIISVYDYGEVDGTLYFTMQLINGRPLSRVLEEIRETGSFDPVIGSSSELPSLGNPESSPFTIASKHSKSTTAYYRVVANWVADVADALQYAHEHGVTHRDIKPSNLLVREDGRIMISDFGLARSHAEASITMTRSLIGTCRYLSPEQVEPSRGPSDSLVDVYALGATLYEMLTLRPIYSARDDKQILHHVLHNDPTPPHRHNSTIPRELETICLKALEKTRARRYQSADQLANDLRRWLLDLPIQARRQSPAQRALRTIRRRRVPIATGAVVLALVWLSTSLFVAHSNASSRGADSEQRASLNESLLSEQEALALFHAEEFDAALQAIDHALDISPVRPEMIHIKARILMRDSARRDAIDLLEAHLVDYPDDAIGHFLAGHALHYEFGHPPNQPWAEDHDHGHTDAIPEHSELKQKWARLLNHLQAIERLMPDSAPALCLRSCVEPDHEIGIEQLTRAIDKDPSLTEALVERAVRIGFTNDWKNTLPDLQRAIELEHAGHRVHGLLAISYYHLERYTECEKALDRAIELNPNNIHWWYDRAVVRTYLNKYEDAIVDATRAIEIDPEYEFSYVARAKGKLGLGNRIGALEDYNLAESIDPTNRDIYSERSELLLQLDRPQEALADANTLISIEPDSASSYITRAEVFLRTQEWDKALSDLEDSERLEPTHAETWRLRGSAYFFSDRFSQAARAYETASQLDPKQHLNYLYRALSLVRLVRHHEAVTTLTRWISTASTPEMGYLRRGAVYEQMGEMSLALADYQAAAEINPDIKGYAKIWSAIILYERGEVTRARMILEALSTDADPWISSIAKHLHGDSSSQTFRSAAISDRQHSEANYYAGVRFLWDDNPTDAKSSFSACVASKHHELFEREFARFRMLSDSASPIFDFN